MGAMGMAYDDFCRLTPEAFGQCVKAWNEREHTRYREDWERMRTLALFVVQPHSKKRLSAHGILPFPWDGESLPGRKETPRLTKEQRKARFEKLIERRINRLSKVE